ncbi:MAG: DUF2726 domain-containing protein [Bradyrhizobiaceae bacterium]|nr:DUF2726 domain-containing protein [Bradyrhizobiaceae bacterium]
MEFIAVTIILLFLLALAGKSRRRFYGPSPRTRSRLLQLGQQQGRDLTDVGQQLHAVMAGSFNRQRVLSPSEYRVFQIVEDEVAAQRAGYRVFAQTSLGEILSSNDREAYSSINSKRVDILVIDSGGWPFLAVEFQGDGHYQGTAAARDAVKKEALRKAGVRYLEFGAADTPDQIKSRLRELFAQGRAGAS